MDYYLTMEHWSEIVRSMKDEERNNNISAQRTSDLAKDILHYVRSARLRQGVLFKQKRGEEYEAFVEGLQQEYDPPAVLRALDNDEFWEACFSLRTV